MKIIAAPDSFKGALSAIEAADAMTEGIRNVDKSIDVVQVPVADGGEGTIDALVYVMCGEKKSVKVTGPLGEEVVAEYGLCGDTAVIEMAKSSGLPLVPLDRRDPKETTTYGVGEIIKAALDRDVHNIIIGLGGSATVDLGCGMAQALGVRFYSGEQIIAEPISGKMLEDITRIDLTTMDPRIKEVNIKAACDVDNPLTGSHGAAYVYGPQKGATPEDVIFLDNALQKTGKLLEKSADIKINDIPGAGAAGGLGAAVLGFLGGELVSGAEMVLKTIGFRDIIKGADCILFGEGMFDTQSFMGKIGGTISTVAKEKGIPFVVIAGGLKGDMKLLHKKGVAAAFSTMDKVMSLEVAMKNAKQLVIDTTSNVMRVFRLIKC